MYVRIDLTSIIPIAPQLHIVDPDQSLDRIAPLHNLQLVILLRDLATSILPIQTTFGRV
jgi:hypothetical protein